MSTATTLANLLEQLGNIAPDRVLLQPPPGMATERDVEQLDRSRGMSCELVDGVLVEKGLGYEESLLACVLIEALRRFVVPRNLGLISGESGMMRLFPGLVRMPDVAFASWSRIPGRAIPQTPIANFVPDLAVEVLSASNTPGEMARKRQEYFDAGVRLVWIVDPETRTVTVFTSPDQSERLDASRILDGGDVLPGFSLPLAELFAELDRTGA